jgi:hypothetical protein
MANENDVEVRFKVTGDTAGADAVAKSVENVSNVTDKAGKQSANAAKSLHEFKEGQEAVKDAAEGLGQALDGRLLAALVNVTKAIRGFSVAGLTGAIGILVGVVTAAASVWNSYKEAQQKANEKLADAKLRAEELAAAAKQRLSEEAAKSFKAWADAVEASAQKAIEAMERARGMADTLADANAEIEIANIETDPSLSADEKERQKIAVRARSADQKLVRKDRALEQEQGRERDEVGKIDKRQEIISDQIREFGENSERGKMLSADWHKLQEERLQREKRIEEIDKEREVVDLKRAANDATRGAEEKALDRKAAEQRGKELDENMKQLGDDWKKERDTRKGISDRIKQSEIDDLQDQADIDKKKSEKKAKALEELEELDVPEVDTETKGSKGAKLRKQAREDFEKTIDRKLEEAGVTGEEAEALREDKLRRFDDKQRGRRSTPGAPNVTPESGFDDLLKRNKDAVEKNAAGAKEVAASVDSAANAIEGAFGSINSRLAALEGRLANMPTLGSGYPA